MTEQDKKFVETSEIREFIADEVERAKNLVKMSRIASVQMDQGVITHLEKCLEKAVYFLEAMTDRVDDYADQIEFLKGHARAWDNDMHRRPNDIRYYKS